MHRPWFSVTFPRLNVTERSAGASMGCNLSNHPDFTIKFVLGVPGTVVHQNFWGFYDDCFCDFTNKPFANDGDCVGEMPSNEQFAMESDAFVDDLPAKNGPFP